MKKVIPILGLSVLIVGCSSSSLAPIDSSITDGNEVIVEGDMIEVTRDDVYHHLMEQYGSNTILDIILEYIADQEITDTELIEERVEESIEQFSQHMENGMEDYAQQLGFDTAEEYIEQVIRPNAKLELLKEKYVEEHYEDIVEDYQVRYIKYITVDTESAAMEIIDQSTSLESFNSFLEDEDKTGQDVGIVTNESTQLDENIRDAFDNFTADGIYSRAIRTSDDKYAVVYVYNTDKDELTEEIKEHLYKLAAVTADFEVHYLRQYNFDVYEERMRQEIKDTNEDYLG